jgi:type I restriction enzyme, S subunit
VIPLQERVHGSSKPEDWQLDKLHRIFRVRRGHKNAGMKEDNLLSLSYGRIIQKDIETADGLLPENFEGYQIVEPGNIVLRLTDLQNDKRSLRQGLVTQSGIITSAYDAVEVQRDNDPRFWFYSLLALDLAKHYYSLGGGVRQSVKFADFPNDWVYLPDLATQRQIADFLDRETARIDLLIEKKQRLVALVEEKRSALITAAVTGQFTVGKLESDVGGAIKEDDELSSTWFRSLPDGWVSRRIKTISPVMRGASPRPIDDPIYFDDEGEYAWVRISDVTASDGLLNSTVQRLSALGASKSVKLECGKLFLSIAGSVGKPCITDIKACIHDGFVYFPYLPVESQKFLYWIFVSRECFSGLGKMGTQLNLNTETVGNISIPFPDLRTQNQIALFLDQETERFDAIKSKTIVSIDRLKEYRSALITAAVTGQIDVATYAKSGTTDRRLDAIQEEMDA